MLLESGFGCWETPDGRSLCFEDSSLRLALETFGRPRDLLDSVDGDPSARATLSGFPEIR